MKKTILLTTASTILAIAASNAATISWAFSNIASTGTVGNIMGTGGLDSSGSLVIAENSGGTAITFDGIDFAAGSYTMGSIYAGYHQNATNSPISSTGTYTGSSATFTLGNGGQGPDLVNGQEYRIQLVLMDGRGSETTRTFEVDGLLTDHAQGVNGVTWGPVRLATGTFTADATSQSMTLEIFKDGPSVGSQLNAFTLHVVPEPSTFALASLGLLSLIGRRRR